VHLEPLTRARARAQLPEAPAKAHVFLEDLPEDEQDAAGFAKYGAGAGPARRPPSTPPPWGAARGARGRRRRQPGRLTPG
jgi:hypothetical protein